MILLVSSDLQAQVRLDGTVQPLGFEVGVRRPDGEMGDVQPSVLILDLDQLGAEGASRWVEQAGDGVRILGFFSHVHEATGTAARASGIETYPRGRFWRELPRLVQISIEKGGST